VAGDAYRRSKASAGANPATLTVARKIARRAPSTGFRPSRRRRPKNSP